jgi:uncharacterized RDD family membrane protein YckC
MNASIWLRFKAFMIDYILILIYLAGLFIFSVFLFPSIQNFFTGSLITAQLTGFLLVTMPVSLYFVISDSKIGNQSFGKRKAGIKVVRDNGEALSSVHGIVRTILKFLPWELSHFLVYRLVDIGEGAVPLSILSSGRPHICTHVCIYTYSHFYEKETSFYDIAVKTYVVKI